MNTTVCETGWAVGEQYFPGYQEGAMALTSPSWKVPAHAKAAMFKAQTDMLNKARGQEAVFCGALASNSEEDKDGPKEPQVGEGQCLTDGQILGMMYYVQGATVEAVFEPEKHIDCHLGQRVERLEGKDPRCVACDAGLFSRSFQASSCTPCALGFFASLPGQSTCTNCDDLGDMYQDLLAQTKCTFCPFNTQRYIGVETGANRTACQCKPGTTGSHDAWSRRTSASLKRICSIMPAWLGESLLLVMLQSRSFAGCYSPKGEAGEVCTICVADAYIYRLNHTLTDSLYFEPGVKLLFVSTRLAIAFVFAGLFGMPTWCRLCREALSPSPPPRLYIRCAFGTDLRTQRCRRADCQMPRRRSLPRWSGVALW